MGLLMLCALTFIARISPNDSKEMSTEGVALWSQYINFNIWKKRKYVIWAVAVPTSMFGYFVPYVHLVTIATDFSNRIN